VISEDEIVLDMKGGSFDMCVIRPKEEEGFLGVIMPMRTY
jgi:DNA polymerase III sliding clamp (beta) subunit (PCNA family)